MQMANSGHRYLEELQFNNLIYDSKCLSVIQQEQRNDRTYSNEQCKLESFIFHKNY